MWFLSSLDLLGAIFKTLIMKVVNSFYWLLFVDHHAHDHTHDPGVSSVSIVCEGEMDLEKASLQITHLIYCSIFSTDIMNIEISEDQNSFTALDMELFVLTSILHALIQADMWLGNLLLEHSDDIYRMKGLLSVSGMPQRFVFQVCANALILSWYVLILLQLWHLYIKAN